MLKASKDTIRSNSFAITEGSSTHNTSASSSCSRPSGNGSRTSSSGHYNADSVGVDGRKIAARRQVRPFFSIQHSPVSLYLIIFLQLWSVVAILLSVQERTRRGNNHEQSKEQRQQLQHAIDALVHLRNPHWLLVAQHERHEEQKLQQQHQNSQHTVQQQNEKLQQQEHKSESSPCKAYPTQFPGGGDPSDAATSGRKKRRRWAKTPHSESPSRRLEKKCKDLVGKLADDEFEWRTVNLVAGAEDEGEELSENEVYILASDATLMREEEGEQNAAEGSSQSKGFNLLECCKKRRECTLSPAEQQLFHDYRDKFRHTQQYIQLHVRRLLAKVALKHREAIAFAKQWWRAARKHIGRIKRSQHEGSNPSYGGKVERKTGEMHGFGDY